MPFQCNRVLLRAMAHVGAYFCRPLAPFLRFAGSDELEGMAYAAIFWPECILSRLRTLARVTTPAYVEPDKACN